MLRRILLQTVIAGYLLVSLAGISFSVLRIRIPFVPDPLFRWSYESMSPWQRFAKNNQDIAIRAKKPDGTWGDISVEKYFPFRRGQRMVMVQLASFRGDEAKLVQYRRLAGLMLREEQRIHPYTALELFAVTWPLSPESRDWLKPFSTSTPLATAP
ncbi:hypothetical protein FJZ28_03065 [Candidatus Peregrinibacteria bacterium]|nr:hypothetical protein [Candidatus Peregrinibacteria bacterium]